jgi:hypothetical protein
VYILIERSKQIKTLNTQENIIMRFTAIVLTAMLFAISTATISFATDTEHNGSDNFAGYRWNGNPKK